MTGANNWYVLTGAPSSGKSTLLDELARFGYTTVEEQGKLLIDQEITAGKNLGEVNVDSPAFELAWTKLQQAREAQVDPNVATFFDRGLLDTLAYFEYYGWSVPPEICARCATAKYKKVFLLEFLDYDKDYFRIESAETAAAMQKLFGAVYQDAGYEVVYVPKATIEQRAKFVMDYVDAKP